MPQLRRFNPTSTTEGRAVQAWLILIGQAMNRQTITYEKLSLLMFSHEAAGVFDQILGRIYTHCDKNGLPLLPALVVGKGRGTPGHAGDLYRELDRERERIYECDWYDIYPPTEEDLTRVDKDPS